MSEQQFYGQREGEEVKLVFRRHILATRKGFLFLILAGCVGILPMVMWPGDARMFWAWLGMLGVGLLGYGYAYMLWYFSIWIVTNERIRQINQKGIFKKTVVDLGLDKIQSVAYDVSGIRAGIFGYGTILVQTAVGDLRMSMVSKPNVVYNELENVVGRKVGNEN